VKATISVWYPLLCLIILTKIVDDDEGSFRKWRSNSQWRNWRPNVGGHVTVSRWHWALSECGTLSTDNVHKHRCSHHLWLLASGGCWVAFAAVAFKATRLWTSVGNCSRTTFYMPQRTPFSQWISSLPSFFPKPTATTVPSNTPTKGASKDTPVVMLL